MPQRIELETQNEKKSLQDVLGDQDLSGQGQDIILGLSSIEEQNMTV